MIAAVLSGRFSNAARGPDARSFASGSVPTAFAPRISSSWTTSSRRLEAFAHATAATTPNVVPKNRPAPARSTREVTIGAVGSVASCNTSERDFSFDEYCKVVWVAINCVYCARNDEVCSKSCASRVRSRTLVEFRGSFARSVSITLILSDRSFNFAPISSISALYPSLLRASELAM